MKRKNTLYFNLNFCILKRKSNNHSFFGFQYPFQNRKSSYQIRTRTHHKPGRAKLFYIWREALQQTTASDEESSHSSGPDSATAADEADLIEGIDHSSDIIYNVGKEEEEEEEERMEVSCCPGTPARGRGTDRPPARRRCSSRSTSERSGPEALPTAGWKTEKEPDSLPSLPHFLPKRRPGVQPPLSEYVDSPSPSDPSKYLDQETIKILFDSTQ
ncbi:uncharacterized protein LOC129348993 [Amphiprion ocellaris]|uniref:uncharacterized protein LOC129348993 n=1 Tax=Amphiprion ocellaris TaxID=80972 RepID=UPI002410E43D|nr:uncharacterized protein LOC129348993 [Amphiprion ocellaris]